MDFSFSTEEEVASTSPNAVTELRSAHCSDTAQADDKPEDGLTREFIEDRIRLTEASLSGHDLNHADVEDIVSDRLLEALLVSRKSQDWDEDFVPITTLMNNRNCRPRFITNRKMHQNREPVSDLESAISYLDDDEFSRRSSNHDSEIVSRLRGECESLSFEDDVISRIDHERVLADLPIEQRQIAALLEMGYKPDPASRVLSIDRMKAYRRRDALREVFADRRKAANIDVDGNDLAA